MCPIAGWEETVHAAKKTAETLPSTAAKPVSEHCRFGTSARGHISHSNPSRFLSKWFQMIIFLRLPFEDIMVIMYLAKLWCFTNLNSGSIRITILTNHHYHHSSEVTTSFHRGNSGEIPCPPCRWYINGTMRSVSTSPSMWATGASRWPRKMPLSGFRAWDILV
jgi:plasmid stabilization system protein ParE